MLKRTQHLQSTHKTHRKMYIIIGAIICILLILLGAYKITSNHSNTQRPTKTYSRDSHMSGIQESSQSKMLSKIQSIDSDEADVELNNNNTQLQFNYERMTGFNKFKPVAKKQYYQFLKASKKNTQQIKFKIDLSNEVKSKLAQQAKQKQQAQQKKQHQIEIQKQKKLQQQQQRIKAQQKRKQINQQKNKNRNKNRNRNKDKQQKPKQKQSTTKSKTKNKRKK